MGDSTWAPATVLSSEAVSDEEACPHHFERQWLPDAGTGRHAAAERLPIMSSCTG